jgi:hypothetical protein
MHPDASETCLIDFLRANDKAKFAVAASMIHQDIAERPDGTGQSVRSQR